MSIRKTLLLLTPAVALIASAGLFLLYWHHHARAVSAEAAPQLTRLPFALPCSTNTADVSLF